MAFSNNQQLMLWMGFLPIGRQASTPAYRQAGLTLRMTAVFLMSS
jgi:hypothetical protein